MCLLGTKKRSRGLLDLRCLQKNRRATWGQVKILDCFAKEFRNYTGGAIHALAAITHAVFQFTTCYPIPYHTYSLQELSEKIRDKSLTHSTEAPSGGSDFIMQELEQKEEVAGEEANDGGSGHRLGQEGRESAAKAKAVQTDRSEPPQPGPLLLTLASSRTDVPGTAPGGATRTGPPLLPGRDTTPSQVRPHGAEASRAPQKAAQGFRPHTLLGIVVPIL